MKIERTIAVLVAVMMVSVIIVASQATEDYEATDTPMGDIKVQYYDGTTWTDKTVIAFDMYSAITAANDSNATNRLTYTLEFASGATSWKKNTSGYDEPNENYGTLTKVNGSTSFTVFVYNNADGSWTVANPALGWYRPFADYGSTAVFTTSGPSAGASNIAIVVGSETTIPTGVGATITLSPITTNAAYTYTFTLKDTLQTVSPTTWPTVTYYDDEDDVWISDSLTATLLANGVKIRGYGSDAYLALRNALGANQVDGQNEITLTHTNPDGSTYLTYYSWLYTILGSGTVSTITDNPDGSKTSTYDYWASYTSTGGYLSFTLGYYSGFTGAPNACSDFNITYERSTWVIPAP